MLDEPRVKNDRISDWLKGGGETLVKILPINLIPDPDKPIGYCTTLKYVVGRTPFEMERLVGLRDNSKLFHGAAVYMVRPLPSSTQFLLRGHSNTPGGISTSIKPADPDYPPGLGCPQFELFGHNQKNLSLLSKVLPGQTFRYVLAQVPPAY